MARPRSFTAQVDRLARTHHERATSRGPVAYGKRVVRRKTHGKEMGLTGRLLKMFGLK
jgi:hypothetical protein